MKSPERAIVKILQDIAGIAGKVHPLRAPDNAKSPYVIVQRTGGERARSINGPSNLAFSNIQIDVYNASYYAGKKIAAAIETLLDGYRGEVVIPAEGGDPSYTVDIRGISLQSEFETIDETAPPLMYRESKTYLVTSKG